MTRQEATAIVSDLFESWYPTLVRYAYHLTRNTALAEDAVQDSFMLLYRELGTDNVIRNPRAWTLCIVRREIARQMRGYGSREISLENDDCLNVARSRRLDDPDLGLEYHDIERALSHLSPREQEVFLLRMESLKCREIASELQISINSVTTLLARALRKLRQGTPDDTASSPQRRKGEDCVSKTLRG
jgi:RNA polymerase sigma-70 factor, ECF subfamily